MVVFLSKLQGPVCTWEKSSAKSLNWPTRFDPCPAHRTVCRGGFPRSLSENDGRADWWAQGMAETHGCSKASNHSCVASQYMTIANRHLAIQGGLEHHQRCHEGAFGTFHCLSWFHFDLRYVFVGQHTVHTDAVSNPSLLDKILEGLMWARALHISIEPRK